MSRLLKLANNIQAEQKLILVKTIAEREMRRAGGRAGCAIVPIVAQFGTNHPISVRLIVQPDRGFIKATRETATDGIAGPQTTDYEAVVVAKPFKAPAGRPA